MASTNDAALDLGESSPYYMLGYVYGRLRMMEQFPQTDLAKQVNSVANIIETWMQIHVPSGATNGN